MKTESHNLAEEIKQKQIHGTYSNVKALHTTRYPPLSDQLQAIFHPLAGIELLCTPSNG